MEYIVEIYQRTVITFHLMENIDFLLTLNTESFIQWTYSMFPIGMLYKHI